MIATPGRLMAVLAPAILVYVVLLAMLPASSNDTWADSAWLVQVSSRMSAGDTLYRDVFSGTTPVAFVVQSLASRVVSDGFLILLVTTHGLFALTLLLTATTAEILGIPRMATLAAFALLTVWITPLPGAAYSWWALAFLAATQLAVACWARWTPWKTNGSWRAAAVAGVMAGLAFCSKPNVGLLALAALVASMAWIGRSTSHGTDKAIRHAGLAVGTFAAVAGSCVLAIAFSGAWDSFLVQNFTGKTVYLSRAGVSYQPFLEQAIDLDAIATRPVGWLRSTIYLVPLCLPGLWFVRRRQNWIPILGIFALAGLAAAYPRPDIHHIFLAAPALALAAAALLSALVPRRLPRLTLIAVGAVAMLAAVLHFRTTAELPRGENDALRQQARTLVPHAPGGTLFVLHEEAPLIYAWTGLRNPTRYDYPLVTGFGPNGQQEVIALIEAGRVPTICAAPNSPQWMDMAPELLLKYVEERLQPGPDLIVCRIYVAPVR